MAVLFKNPKGNSFIALKKIDNNIILYEPSFGNPVKIPGFMEGSTFLLRSSFLRLQQKNPKNFGVKFFKNDSSNGFKADESYFTHIPGFTDKGKLKGLSLKPTIKYDPLIPIETFLYCIKASNGCYFLYDWNMGNPVIPKEFKNYTKPIYKAMMRKDIIPLIPKSIKIFFLEYSPNEGLVRSEKLKSAEDIKKEASKDDVEKNTTNIRKDVKNNKARNDEIKKEINES